MNRMESSLVLKDRQRMSLMEKESENSLFDLEGTHESGFFDSVTSRHIRYAHLLAKMSSVQLDPISIPPSTAATAASAPHILNLKQEFTFPVSRCKSHNEVGTQTLSPIESRVKTPHPIALARLHVLKRQESSASRPHSDPTSSSHNLFVSRVTADVKPTLPTPYNTMRIGDGIESYLKQIKCNAINLDAKEECQTPPEKSTVMKPPTAHFRCGKIFRPTTRHRHKTNDCGNTKLSSESQIKKSYGREQQQQQQERCDTNSEGGVNYHQRLCTLTDQLQDLNWEVCNEALKALMLVTPRVCWESESIARFVPVISRKFIDFFRSPRSNLCRTACQAAGDFFVSSKMTKRPEFDEMVDLLLSRTADQNRFIQKDANNALDKMAHSIPIQHSIRAISTRAPANKNAFVRATAARLLANICKQAGIEQIIGVQANARTRKRVLNVLAKFLVDKNVETRRHAERLCCMLKTHKFFNDYFFKDVENNMKMPLRRIINNIN